MCGACGHQHITLVTHLRVPMLRQIDDIDSTLSMVRIHSKLMFTGRDIFTGTKYMDMCPMSHNMRAPVVKTAEWGLSDITEENYLFLMNDEGETKEDMELPSGERGEELRRLFASTTEGGVQEVVCTVISAGGKHVIVGWEARGW